MKKNLLLLGSALLFCSSAMIAQTTQVRRCAAQQMHQAMIASDPAWAQKFESQRAALQSDAENYMQMVGDQGSAEKTTTISAIPVIFHIVVDTTQYNSLGGATGIAKRCDSQIAILNRDFNRQNSDSTLIPSGWKPLYGNAGIHFGLARRDPNGVCTPGYEIKIITATGFSNINSAFPEAKTAATGLPSWDVTKYYNVWCINFTGSASSLLGITLPKSSTSGSNINQEGVCILYNTLGKGGTGTGSYFAPYDKGRTLTHETGHFFEIWHPWGDDGGKCTTYSSTATVNGITCVGGMGSDDGLSDTPPESDAVYGAPTYNVTGGTEYDCCKMNGTTNMQPIGIACLSFMDYTDDAAMYLFTTMQAAAMASKVLVASGENYQLTQNPSLLVCPTAIVEQVSAGASLNVYPNPTAGLVNITVNSLAEDLKNITVLNILGQEVATVNGEKKDNYVIDLSGMSKGVYVLKFNFASGSVTRKVTLQ